MKRSHTMLLRAVILVSFVILCVWIFSVPLHVSYESPPRPGAETGGKKEEQPRARVLFVGDLLYDRTIRREADAKGDEFIFSCMADDLHEYDMVIANLEGPITHHESVSLGSKIGSPGNFRFTFPLRAAEVLARNNIRAVSLANNHINDFGPEGITETRAALEAASVAYAGDPRDPENISTRIKVNGMPITLVAYNEFYGFTMDETIAHIEELEEGGLVIVFAHWGDEYADVHERQRTWARQFVDAGADLVVGAHPHVVQESERVGDVSVYYSLGNFIFDQYMDEEVMTGLALEVILGKNGIEDIHERTVRLGRDRRTCFDE